MAKCFENKALLYIRVSSKPQEEDGFSLPAQKRLAYDYALHNELEIVKTYEGVEVQRLLEEMLI